MEHGGVLIQDRGVSGETDGSARWIPPPGSSSFAITMRTHAALAHPLALSRQAAVAIHRYRTHRRSETLGVDRRLAPR